MKKIILLSIFYGLFFSSYSIDINFVKQIEGTSRAAAFYGENAYVSTGHKINILDVSDPESIQIVNSFMINDWNYVNCLIVDENKEILVVGMDFHVRIYSITNPISPVLLSSIQNGCNKAIIDGNTLISGDDHIIFYDISDVSNPVYLSSILVDYSSGNFCITDNILYSFTQTGYSGPHAIVSYDISSLSNPQYITNLEIGPYYAPWPDEIEAKSDLIFLALADSLKIFETNGIGDITYISWFVFPAEIHSFHIDGNYLYAGLETGLKIYDISDIENIQEAGDYEYETYIRDIDVAGNLTFIAGNTNGYKILKTGNLSNIEEKFYFPYTDISYGICLNGNLAFLSLYERGLQAVFLEDPVNPENIASVEAGPMRELKYKDHAVYGMKVKGADTLLVYNVTDVFQMSLAATITSQTGISDFVFAGDYLLINEYNQGVRIFDISDPLNPEEAGTVPIVSGTELAVDNNTLFIGGQYGMTDTARIKIAAYDISNLPQMSFLNEYFFDDIQKYHIKKIMPVLPNLYIGVWKGVVAMTFDGEFTVNDELLYPDPDYNHCSNFLKDNDYIFFNIISNTFDTKAIKILNGTQLQEDPLSVDFVPNVKYDQYFYSIGYKNGYSIYKQGELIFDPPQNLVANGNDCTIDLSWDPPQSGTPSYYLIYQNGEQIDSITGTFYTLELYFSSYNEFYVVAGYIDPNGVSEPSNAVIIAIPGGCLVPYWENFEYDCINWFSTPITGNDDFYHCDTVSYEGDYSLAWYSETPGAETKCGPQYITPVICPEIFVSFYYKTPVKNGNYDKLYLYLDENLLAGPLEPANDWTYFYSTLDDCYGFDFNLDFKAVADNGGGIFIDKYIVDAETGIDESMATDNIKLFPNPAGNTLNIEINNESAQTCIIEVITTEGNTVKHLTKAITGSGNQTVSIDVSDLKNGIYFLKIIFNDGIAIKKFKVTH